MNTTNNYLKFWSLCDKCDFEDLADWQENKEMREATRSHTATRLKNLDDCLREILIDENIPESTLYNFIDVGSGDGLVLLLATTHKRFKRIIGIEKTAHHIATDKNDNLMAVAPSGMPKT